MLPVGLLLTLAHAAELVALPDGTFALRSHVGVQVFDPATGAARRVLPTTSGGYSLSVVDGRLVVVDSGYAFTWEGDRLIGVEVAPPAPPASEASRPACLPFAGGEVCTGVQPPPPDRPECRRPGMTCEYDPEDRPEDFFAHLRVGERDVAMPSCRVLGVSSTAVLLGGHYSFTLADASGATLVRVRTQEHWERTAVGETAVVASAYKKLLVLGTDGSTHSWPAPAAPVSGGTWSTPKGPLCLLMNAAYLGVVGCETGDVVGLLPYEETNGRPWERVWGWTVRGGEATGPTLRIGATGWAAAAGLAQVSPAHKPENGAADGVAHHDYHGRTLAVDAGGETRWSRTLTGGDGGGGLVQPSPVPRWITVTHWDHGKWTWELFNWKTGATLDAGDGEPDPRRYAPPLLGIREDGETWRVRDAGARRWVGTWSTEVRPLAQGDDGTVWVTGGGAEAPWIAAVNAAGEERWRVPAPGGVVGGAVAAGKLLLAGDADHLYALDGATGAVKWTKAWAGGVEGALRLR